MSEPTLTAIPGILLRTILRLVARIILVLAGALLLGGIALAIVCLLLGTWRTPRSRKWQLISDIILLTTELVKERRRVSKSESV